MQGTCAIDCRDGYNHAASHMFNKNVEVSTFFSRPFTITVIDIRKSDKVPDLRRKKMSILNVATAANDKRQFH